MEALARIFVPSIATVPNLPKPARAAIINTCENKSVNASCASPRNLAMVVWSGTSWAHSTRNATSVRHSRSICREERTPWQ